MMSEKTRPAVRIFLVFGGLWIGIMVASACSDADDTPPPGPPASITDEFGVRMALVPAGPFNMGSDSGSDDERPVHTVTLDDFYLDIYEVTNAQFAACVDAEICDTPADTTAFDSSYSRLHYYGNPVYDHYPVIYVSWYDAQAYCGRRGARLPTEAEWEKAARGGLEGAAYPWGDDPPVRKFLATNGAAFNDGSSATDTEQVGGYDPNGYGLFDMAGNLWEWVSDSYDENYYANSPDRDPSGPDTNGFPVIRGGSWNDSEINLRVSDRRFNPPDSGALNIGFRCARDAAP